MGEWWSILILRDAFRGLTRFDQFQKSLDIAPNILTRRLNTLNLHFLCLAEHLNSGNPAMLRYVQQVATNETVARGVDAPHGHAAALKVPWSLTLREAQMPSFADTFLAIALCFVIATAMVPTESTLGLTASAAQDVDDAVRRDVGGILYGSRGHCGPWVVGPEPCQCCSAQ